eukprot:9346-Heterococcus_DN1.PRE.1
MDDNHVWDGLFEQVEKDYEERLDQSIAHTQKQLMEADAAFKDSLAKLAADHGSRLTNLRRKAEYEMRRSRLHEQQQQRTQRAEVLAAAQMQRRAQLMRVSDVDSSSNANARLQQRPSSAAGAVPSHTNKSAVQAPVAAHTTAELTATAHAVNPLTASNSS